MPTDIISHLAVVEAQDFEHRKLIAHIGDALSHLTWQLVVAKIKCKQPLELGYCLDKATRHAIIYFELFHLEVLNMAALMAKEIYQELQLFPFNVHGIDSQGQNGGLSGEGLG